VLSLLAIEILYFGVKLNFKLFGLILIQALIFLIFHLFTTKNPIGVFLLGIVSGFLFVVAKNDILEFKNYKSPPLK
jgi:hypothetical protein